MAQILINCVFDQFKLVKVKLFQMNVCLIYIYLIQRTCILFFCTKRQKNCSNYSTHHSEVVLTLVTKWVTRVDCLYLVKQLLLYNIYIYIYIYI